MKQFDPTENNSQIRRLSTVKTIIAAGAALVMLAAGGIAVYGFSDVSDDASDVAVKAEVSSVTDTPAQTSASVSLPAASLTEGFVPQWKKAPISVYDLAAVSIATTTTTTTTTAAATTTTTSAAPTATTTAAPVTTTTAKPTTTKAATTALTFKAVSGKKIYAKGYATHRVSPSNSASIIWYINPNSEMSVISVSSDNAWYYVRYKSMNGYVLASQTTEVKPAVATTTTTTTTTKAATKAPTAAATTTAGKTTVKLNANGERITYTQEEFDMLCYVVSHEVGNCTEQYKLAIASAIINRVESPKFANNLKAVLTAPNQFCTDFGNPRYKPSQNTINCCKRALRGEGADLIKGATAFYTPKYCSASARAWFENNLQYCASIYDRDGTEGRFLKHKGT